jgi:hypothetical protein
LSIIVSFIQYYDKIEYFFERIQTSQTRHLSQDNRMETTYHGLSNLFKQLGLPHEPDAVAQFITQHQGACRHCSLLEAPIWTPSQLAFLSEAIAQDADWAGVAERLQADLA